MRGLTVRMEGIDRRQNGAGIVHILKFYEFYEVVYGIPWLGASFAKSCGAPNDIRSIPQTPKRYVKRYVFFRVSHRFLQRGEVGYIFG